MRDTQDELMAHDFLVNSPQSSGRSVALFKFAPIAELFDNAVREYNSELMMFQELLKTVQREQSQRQMAPPSNNAAYGSNSATNGQVAQVPPQRQKRQPMAAQSAQALPREASPRTNSMPTRLKPQMGAPPNIARKSAPSQQRQSRPPIARQPQQPPMSVPTNRDRNAQPVQPVHRQQPQQPRESQRDFVPSSSLLYGSEPQVKSRNPPRSAQPAMPRSSNGVATHRQRTVQQQQPQKPPQARQPRQARQPAVAPMQMRQPEPVTAMAQEYSDEKRRRKGKQPKKRQEEVPPPQQPIQPQPVVQQVQAVQPMPEPEPKQVIPMAPSVLLSGVPQADGFDSDGFDVEDHHELHVQNQQMHSEASREQEEKKRREREKEQAFMATRVKYSSLLLPKKKRLTYVYSNAGFKVTDEDLADGGIYTSSRLTLSGVAGIENLKADREKDRNKIRNVMVSECKFKAEHISEVHIKDGRPWCIVHVRCPLKTIKQKLKALKQRNDRRKREQSVDYSKLVSLREFVRRPPDSDMEADENRRLYVLNFDILNKKCHQAMTNLFLRFGDLDRDIVIKLSRDKRDPCAFVEFKRLEDARKVWKYQNRNGEPQKPITFGKRVLNIQYSRTPPGTREPNRRAR